jgi:hypothetical protein
LQTRMPSYKLALSEDERWKLVALIQADFSTDK